MSHPVENKYRYPGATPFTTEQSNLFFGRKQDTKDLYRLIKREPLVVLYGKSGLGKSSLINAGVVPECQKEKKYTPLIIRFGAWTDSTTISPLEIIKNVISNSKKETVLTKLILSDNSLWRYAKGMHLNDGGKPLVIFDQFEELFSYPEIQIEDFQQEITELVNTGIPLRFRRALDKIVDITDEEEEILEASLDARILFVIRSDRMHLLDKLTTYLPNILRNCFELKALKKGDARNAIVLPAQALGEFATQPFQYSDDTVTSLLRFLEDGHDKRIEGILLQMLCEHYERIQVKHHGKRVLEIQDIDDPNDVVKNYYEEKLQCFDEAERKAVRMLIEEGLVSEGEAMRLTLHEAYIIQEFKVSKLLLEKLVNSRLLRSEPFLRGGYTYELSHDRLITPVVGIRAERREEEAELENRRLREVADQERNLKEKAQRQLRLLRFYFILVLVAFGTSVYFNRKAVAARIDAQRALSNFQESEAKKAVLSFNNLESRANVILEVGGCPNDFIKEMKEIAIKHPDSLILFDKIKALMLKNPSCK